MRKLASIAVRPHLIYFTLLAGVMSDFLTLSRSDVELRKELHNDYDPVPMLRETHC